MKSLLKEASSIMKAIEKAWSEAGKPDVFTIKVFAPEQRNIFGFVKHPATVSILYEPKRTSEKPFVRNKGMQAYATGAIGRVVTPTRSTSKGEYAAWQPHFLMDISRWLKELLEFIGPRYTFNLSEDRGLLKIEFSKPVIHELDYERMLFSSFAYLLMQFLKRKYRNKFRGLRLSINSQR